MARDTREAILAAALDVFSESGFHGATVPEVARRAGVGAGTIYRHFENKEDLGNVLFLEWKRRYVHHVLHALSDQGPWRLRFRLMWQAMVSFALENPGVLEYLEFHHHGSYLVPEAQVLSQQLGQALTSLLEQGQADEVFVDQPSSLLLHMVYGSFLRLVRARASGALPDAPDLFERAEERAWAMIRR